MPAGTGQRWEKQRFFAQSGRGSLKPEDCAKTAADAAQKRSARCHQARKGVGPVKGSVPRFYSFFISFAM
jgi:hypothetical protein